MSHTRQCLDSNRFGDGFDCICPPPPLVVLTVEDRKNALKDYNPMSPGYANAFMAGWDAYAAVQTRLQKKGEKSR